MLRLGALLAAGEAPGEASAGCFGFSLPGTDRQTLLDRQTPLILKSYRWPLVCGSLVSFLPKSAFLR